MTTGAGRHIHEDWRQLCVGHCGHWSKIHRHWSLRCLYKELEQCIRLHALNDWNRLCVGHGGHGNNAVDHRRRRCAAHKRRSCRAENVVVGTAETMCLRSRTQNTARSFNATCWGQNGKGGGGGGEDGVMRMCGVSVRSVRDMECVKRIGRYLVGKPRA